jgi:hypothetical protein
LVPSNPTWAEQVASFCPVRELIPGDRPRDWIEQDDLSAPARVEEKLEKLLQFKVQFTATEEHIDLMERAAIPRKRIMALLALVAVAPSRHVAKSSRAVELPQSDFRERPEGVDRPG